MSFFDKILKGLGFEGDELPKEKKEKPQKQEKEKKVNNAFNLQELNTKKEKKVVEISPQNQQGVQSAIDFLKAGNSIKIDLSAFSENDIFRAMDFVWGACYCLGANIKKLSDTTFLLSY
ncbi:MAG: cell division protein SepF [Clostridia bacterium]|nr:cell division protein SepF [Clostridia bacterium]